MNGLIVLANGFEDTEGLTTIDILKRANISLDIIGVETDTFVTTQYGNKIQISKLLDTIDTSKYDFLIIPGGGAVKKVLIKNKLLEKVVKEFVNENKLICAICAGPLVIGRLGYFSDKKYTCFPGVEKEITGKYTGKGVTVCDNFITAKSMAYTIDFALEIIEKLQGKDARKRIKNMIYGELS